MFNERKKICFTKEVGFPLTKTVGIIEILTSSIFFQNFYLIDPYLLVFIVTMVARRFVYALLRRFIDAVSPARWLPAAQRVMRYCFVISR